MSEPTRDQPKMFTTRAVVAIGVVCLIVGGVLGSTIGADTTVVAPTAAPPLSQKPIHPLDVGESTTTARGNTVTFYGWKPDADWPIPATKGNTFSVGEVQWCAGNSEAIPIPVGDIVRRWSMEMPDHTLVAANVVHSFHPDELKEQFETTLRPGACARGKIVFETPKGVAPIRAVFTGIGTIRWDIPPFDTESTPSSTPAPASPSPAS